DQYGDPAKGEIGLVSTEATGVHRPSSRTGGFPVAYTTKETENGAAQEFGAYWVTGKGDDEDDPNDDPITTGDGATGSTRNDADLDTTTSELTVYWAVKEPSSGEQSDLEIVDFDTDENTIVVSVSSVIKYADYDSGDQFSITDSNGTRAVLMDTFEEELDTEHSIDWIVSDNGVSTFTLDIT
ncbi:MAG: hypothetical protein OXH01_06385, partial [Bacteroidetes bacterium]|nr:hypothetical protein [Bacteroidota bacterium]